MPRQGYKSITLDDELIKKLDHIAKDFGLKDRVNTIRVLVKEYEKTKSVKKALIEK